MCMGSVSSVVFMYNACVHNVPNMATYGKRQFAYKFYFALYKYLIIIIIIWWAKIMEQFR